MKVTGAALTRRGAGCHSVELRTDGGHTGVALLDALAVPHARRIAAAVLKGADPRAATALFERMTRAAGRRPGRAVRRAIAALDVALWDLAARARGEPLWRTLGGDRPRANAHAAWRKSGSDAELSGWFARMARVYGLRGGLVRAAGVVGADLRRLTLARDALSAATAVPALMLDAGGRWPAAQSVRRVRAIEKAFDLTWIEGAARGGSANALSRVSDGVSAAVCAGADWPTAADFRAHFEQASIDVVQLDIGLVGISGALVIADAAFGLELPVALRAAPGNLHAHLAGVIPGFMSMEVLDPSPVTAYGKSDVRIEGGWGVAGDVPGHGLVFS